MKKTSKKTKYITAVVLFVLLSICNVIFSAMLHNLLSKNPEWMHLAGFSYSLHVVMEIKGARLIFLAIEVFIILGLVAAQITRVTEYKSELVKITDDIYIPKRAGENQYGSARFYTEAELSKVFTEIRINKSDELICQLMEHGYDDLEFMQ